MTGHMLKYHVLIPLAIVAVLLVVGVPFGTAFVIGMMTGCMSMMLMMMGGASRHRDHTSQRNDDRERRVKQ